MERNNKGKVPAGGEIVVSIAPDWTLYKIDSTKFKLVADAPVKGKANYGLKIVDNVIQFDLDKGKLRTERPELLLALEAYLSGENPEIIHNVADDPYGDLAIARGHKLTEKQTWTRKLVNMRVTYLTQSASGLATDVTRMIYAHFNGLYRTEPTLADIDAAAEFITKGTVPCTADLVAELRNYYDGKYKPKSLETLAINLDILTGAFA